MDQVSQNVTELTKTIHDGFTELSAAITKLALAALTKQDGFKSGDVKIAEQRQIIEVPVDNKSAAIS